MTRPDTIDASLAAVDAVLERLRHIKDPHELERRFCRDVAAGTGFARVMVSRIEQDVWRPWAVSWATNPDHDRDFATRLRGRRIAFDESPVERRACARREPVICNDGTAPQALAGRARTYAVVPVVGSTGIFALVHADHGLDTKGIGRIDRACLWLLVDGLSRRYERALFAERIRNQHTILRAALDTVKADAEQLASLPVDLSDMRFAPDAPAAPPPDRALAHVLSPRERDVAQLMAQGSNNAVIARELIIAEGTVKTHVKKIMRKLGAATRAEAVANILRAGAAPD